MSAIDPGCEGQVKKAAEDVEASAGTPLARPQSENRDPDEEDDLMKPSSWWFASTVCPLLAGTFGPMANAFSICALAYCWRNYIPPGGTEEDGVKIPDPKWALSVNGISLAFALVGNFALLANMGRRLRFTIAQPITILGFLVAGVMLIAIMSVFNSSNDYFISETRAIPDARHALTGAYYYAGFAAGIYFIIAALLCLTVYGARTGRYSKDFSLTTSQRTLMLQTMSFVGYLLVGALVFSATEDWIYLDSLYWADVTLLTVGLGDYAPDNSLSRGLLFPFALGGILIIGLVIGSIRSLVLERGREKMSARIVEKRRETAVHNVDTNTQTIRISWFARAEFCTDPALSPAQRREEEFTVMRKVQKIADRERRYFSLVMSMVFVILLWFLGALVFTYTEVDQGWTYFDALYFAFVVLLTIGYGDLSPKSNSGRAFFVFWSLLAVPSLTILISNMGDTIVKGFSDLTIWIGSITVLPGEKGIRATFTIFMKAMFKQSVRTVSYFTPPGILGDIHKNPLERVDRDEHWNNVLDHLAGRLMQHVEQGDLEKLRVTIRGDALLGDIHFYHYVLARECRELQKNLDNEPPTQYSWGEWEYFLRLMGNACTEGFRRPGKQQMGSMTPESLKVHRPPPPPGEPSGGDSPTDDHAQEKPGTSSSTDEDTKHIEWDVGVNSDHHGHRREGRSLSRAATSGGSDQRSRDEGVSFSRATTIANSTDQRSRDDGVSLSRTTTMSGGLEAESTAGPHAAKSRHHLRHSLSRHRHGHWRHRLHDDDPLRDWSWLSSESPLMSQKPESLWILERLLASLERELNCLREGRRKKPPISIKDIDRITDVDANLREKAEKHERDSEARADALEVQKLAVAALD